MLLQQQHLAWRHAVPYREHRMIIVRTQPLPTPRRQRVAQRQPRLRPEHFEAEPRLFGEFLGAVVVSSCPYGTSFLLRRGDLHGHPCSGCSLQRRQFGPTQPYGSSHLHYTPSMREKSTGYQQPRVRYLRTLCACNLALRQKR